jgi:hypothetical protein
VTRFAYTILAIFFIASAICSAFALVRVKDLEAQKYHTYARADIDRIDNESRHWMILGVVGVAATVLTFIPLAILPALVRLGRAVRNHARLTATGDDAGDRPRR